MVRLRVIQKVLGLLLAIFSLAMLPPMTYSLYEGDGTFFAFLSAAITTLVAGILLWYPVRKIDDELKLRDGFLIVVLFWLVLGVSGAIPFIVAEQAKMSIADGIFESIFSKTIFRWI